MDTKPFTTLNKQMRLLRRRVLEVPPTAKRTLERTGYYSLINGYKWLFLARESNGNPVSPERFIPRAKFSDIEAIYDFDNELRQILYNYLSIYESRLSSVVAYRFSESYPEPHSYLALDNFTQNPDNIKTVVRTISKLSGTISFQSDKETAIKHYVNKHRHVPLWVLVNFLTFGDLNYLFKIMTDDVRIQIAKDFKKYRDQTYLKTANYSKYSSIIEPIAIDSINKVVNQFRNSVAHGEVTFSKRLDRPANMTPIKRSLELSGHLNYESTGETGTFELLLCLKVVLDKNDFKNLLRSFKKMIDKFQNKFVSIDFDNVLKDMHFPENYHEILHDHI